MKSAFNFLNLKIFISYNKHKGIPRFRKLEDEDIIAYQKKGYFDEHLITLNSLVYGQPFIYNDTYPIYWDPLSKTIWIDLFELNESKNRIQCILDSLAKFNPKTLMIVSPEKLQLNLSNYSCRHVYFDRDYQIDLEKFDEKFQGNSYKDLRYSMKNADKQGYTFSIGKEFTPAHNYILALHMTKKTYNLWDYQAYLKIEEYVEKFQSPMLFNAFLDDCLVGFDVVDILNNTMATPFGFYLNYCYLADFLMYKEITYAKERGFKWLDIGWGCNPGLEGFKKKWKAIPRFNIYLSEYLKI